MKTDIEIKNAIFERNEKYREAKRKSAIKYTVTAFCLLAVTAGSLAIYKNYLSPSVKVVTDGSETDVIPTKIDISDARLIMTGEPLTDAEIDEYLKDNLTWIVNSLSASGVNVSDAKVQSVGYGHIKVTENGLSINRSFRNRLLFNGDNLAAELTFVKENGKIYANISFGGAWYADYHKIFSAYEGEELVCGYTGNIEFMITKTGEVIYPAGNPVESLTNDIAKAIYESSCQEAIFIP